MYPWVVFVHVLSSFVFFLSHGASAFVLLKVRTEREPQRIKTLLDLRAYAMSWSAGVLFLSGIVAGFMGRWWGTVWIWASLVLLILASAFHPVLALIDFWLGVKLLRDTSNPASRAA